MRVLFVIALLAGPAAADCPIARGGDDWGKQVDSAIAKATCETAVDIATRCGEADGIGTAFSNRAADVCRADFAKNKDDVALFDKLGKRCEAKWAKSSGTMYRFFAAYCRMDVARVLSKLNLPGEE